MLFTVCCTMRNVCLCFPVRSMSASPTHWDTPFGFISVSVFLDLCSDRCSQPLSSNTSPQPLHTHLNTHTRTKLTHTHTHKHTHKHTHSLTNIHSTVIQDCLGGRSPSLFVRVLQLHVVSVDVLTTITDRRNLKFSDNTGGRLHIINNRSCSMLFSSEFYFSFHRSNTI